MAFVKCCKAAKTYLYYHDIVRLLVIRVRLQQNDTTVSEEKCKFHMSSVYGKSAFRTGYWTHRIKG